MTTVLLHDTIGSMTEAELAGRFGAETARLAFAFADPPLAPARRIPGARGARLI